LESESFLRRCIEEQTQRFTPTAYQERSRTCRPPVLDLSQLKQKVQTERGTIMALTKLSNESLQFIMFGGKGGVGKTTMAAATALELAKEKKVLLFTTDPAPSLTDSFGQVIGHEPTAIVGTNNLFAMEIDAKKVLQEFKEKYAKDILGDSQK
jgi:Holliday junction resolvasome RuvABC ATP-dependent DNA helicase subunit